MVWFARLGSVPTAYVSFAEKGFSMRKLALLMATTMMVGANIGAAAAAPVSGDAGNPAELGQRRARHPQHRHAVSPVRRARPVATSNETATANQGSFAQAPTYAPPAPPPPPAAPYYPPAAPVAAAPFAIGPGGIIVALATLTAVTLGVITGTNHTHSRPTSP